MDNEILEILKTVQGNIETMQNDMKSMQKEQKETNQRLERVENKTDKNTLMLEDINKKNEHNCRGLYILWRTIRQGKGSR